MILSDKKSLLRYPVLFSSRLQIDEKTDTQSGVLE